MEKLILYFQESLSRPSPRHRAGNYHYVQGLRIMSPEHRTTMSPWDEDYPVASRSKAYIKIGIIFFCKFLPFFRRGDKLKSKEIETANILNSKRIS